MSGVPQRVRVLVADDQPVALAGTAQHLTANGLEICAVIDDLSRLLPAYEVQRPDVVLIETSMGGRGSVVGVISELRHLHPDALVVAFTAEMTLTAVETALDVGFRGIVPKTSTIPALLTAIETVVGGDRHLHPRAAAVLLGRAREPVPAMLATTLSPRERTVLLRMADGLTNRAIGTELGISETTVKTHVGNILRKLGAADRAQAVARSLRSGLID